MALSKFKKMLVDEDYDDEEEIEEEKANHSTPTSDSGKMILLEPRAYSESQQIADHLKKKK